MTRFTRDIRRCALQAMYQFDCGNDRDLDMVRASLEDAPGNEQTHERGFDLATLAWESRTEADRRVAALTPEWPTYRQPVVDRNLLRLAFYEMTDGGIPPKIAINEAVELAKEYGSEKSPMFINGVLDKIFRELRQAGVVADEPEPSNDPTEEPSGANG